MGSERSTAEVSGRPLTAEPLVPGPREPLSIMGCKVTEAPAELDHSRFERSFEHHAEVYPGHWMTFIVGRQNRDFTRTRICHFACFKYVRLFPLLRFGNQGTSIDTRIA